MDQVRKPRRRTSGETEALLLDAATQVFSSKGYLSATVDDIILLAGVSRGAFYLYFRNKEDIFDRLVDIVVTDLIALSRGNKESSPTAKDRLLSANRGYLEAFSRHRDFLRNLYQVSSFNHEVAAKQQMLRRNFMIRVQRSIEKGIAEGRCRPINAEIASYALGYMVEYVAYHWLSTQETPPFEFESVLTTLTDLWHHAIYFDEK